MTAYMPKAKSMEWETPQDLFDKLNSEFHFTLDVCASPGNAKCSKYYTKEIDGLKQSWGSECCYMNPPYGLPIREWIRKAYEESLRGATVVCLLPTRTDTGWFHDYAMKGEIRFLRGRLKFGKNSKQSSTFPSMIVIFRAFGGL